MGRRKKYIMDSQSPEEVIKENESSSSVYYKFVHGDEPNFEYYTIEKPLFDSENSIFQFKNCYLKKSISKTIGKEQIIAEYSSKIDDFRVNIYTGIYLITIDAVEVEQWINLTEEDANRFIKEKTLSIYENLIPDLFENVDVLRQENEKLKETLRQKQQQQQNQQQRIQQQQQPQSPQKGNGLMDI